MPISDKEIHLPVNYLHGWQGASSIVLPMANSFGMSGVHQQELFAFRLTAPYSTTSSSGVYIYYILIFINTHFEFKFNCGLQLLVSTHYVNTQS